MWSQYNVRDDDKRVGAKINRKLILCKTYIRAGDLLIRVVCLSVYVKAMRQLLREIVIADNERVCV